MRNRSPFKTQDTDTTSIEVMEDLRREIENAKTIDQCLDLTRLYIKRSMDLAPEKSNTVKS